VSFDLTQIWNAIQNVLSYIANIISYLFTYVSDVVNTGQGIALGLSYLTSGLWDALIKGSEAIRQGFVALMKPIHEGLIYLSNILSTAWTALSNAIWYVSNSIYYFGNWVFAGVMYANRVLNAVLFRLWSGFIESVNNAFSNIINWWNNLASSVNTWFTNLIKTFRNKVKLTIMTDVSLYFGWKALESSFSSASISKLPFAVLGVVSSPFVGYIFGEIVDALLPTPSTTEFPLIPPIGLIPITVSEIEAPPEPPITYPPSPPSPPPPAGYGLPYDLTLTITPGESVDTTTASKDVRLTIITTESVETTLESADGSLTPPSLTYETVVS
jgi:hypothetical protein